jgi:PAS domain S-box-containing protein
MMNAGNLFTGNTHRRGLGVQIAAAAALVPLYLALRFAANELQVVPDESPWDPAAGLCLAWIVMFGPWQAVAILCATLISDRLHLPRSLSGSLITLGMFKHAAFVACTYLAAERVLSSRWIQFSGSLRTQRSLSMFVLAALATPVPLALYGALMHAGRGAVEPERFAAAAFHYWVVETIGTLSIGALCLTIRDRMNERRRAGTGVRQPRIDMAETVAQILALALAVGCTFFLPGPSTMHTHYLVIPALVWIVMRRGVFGGVLGLVAFNAAAMVGASIKEYQGVPMIDLQTFLLVLSSSTLLLAGIAQETRQAQERLVSSADRYRVMFESNPHPMWAYDRSSLAMLDVNDAAVLQYGYTRPEFLAMRASDLLASDERPLPSTPGPLPTINHSGIWHHRRKDGSVLEVDIVSGHMKSLGPHARLVLARDVTETRRVERARQQAESALREALQRLVSLVDHSPIAVIEWDHPQFRVVRWSGEAERIFGWTASEVMGKHPGAWKFVHDADREYVGTVLNDLIAGTPRRPILNRNYTADGRVLWCEWHNSLITGESGQILSILSLVSDVTDRERARAQVAEWKNRYEAAARASGQLVYELVYDTGEIVWGADTTEMFGCNPGRLSRIDQWVERVHPDDRPDYDKAKARLIADRRAFHHVYRFRRDDGLYVHVRDTAQFFLDASGHSTRMVGFVSDVSEQVQAREDLALRAGELARSNAELERFAYVASHDLQEPLRMVISFTQLLADRYKGRLDADADEFIGFAVDGATRMRRLIDDLLTYSRVSTGPRNYELIDANAAAERALFNLGIAVKESQAQIEIKPLPTLLADETRLTLLFQNLIGNAVKFRRGGEAPVVRVWAEPLRDSTRFVIEDNGIGIEDRHRERIFQIFQRLNPRNQYQGNGIGLSICKKIVEDMGGTIDVESVPQRGSRFYFTVPCSQKTSS